MSPVQGRPEIENFLHRNYYARIPHAGGGRSFSQHDHAAEGVPGECGPVWSDIFPLVNNNRPRRSAEAGGGYLELWGNRCEEVEQRVVVECYRSLRFMNSQQRKKGPTRTRGGSETEAGQVGLKNKSKPFD